MREMKPLVIVPSAGFGRRVGSPEAKEMLLRPDGSRMIDLPLKFAKLRGWPVHVISRIEKKSLIEYCATWTPKPTIQIVEPTFDWPETILLSEPYWRDWNIVFLPDMEFAPESALDEMASLMRRPQLDLVVARHRVERLATWGSIFETGDDDIFKSNNRLSDLNSCPTSISNNDSKFETNESVVAIVEKPREDKAGWAWGLYAFRAQSGRALLEAQLASCRDHEVRKLRMKAAFVELTSFCDLTR